MVLEFYDLDYFSETSTLPDLGLAEELPHEK